MSTLLKLALVFGGYVAALLVTGAAFFVWTQLHISRGSQGMQAFGDAILFIGLFCVLALIPTGLALYFLRPFEKLWRVLSIASLVFAGTALVAVIARWLPHGATVELLAFARMMTAPLPGVGFLICGLFAPARRWRRLLLAAGGIEMVVSAYAFASMTVLGQWPR